MGDRLSDLEIQRLKREGRDRLMRDVNRMLNPKPVRRTHPLWYLAGICTGMILLATFLVIPAAFQ